MDTPDRPTAHSEAVAPAPWYQRVLPLTLCVLVVIAVAAVLVPGLRHQLALSLTRQPVAYVELYFASPTTAGAQAACIRKGESVRVRFVIESHLAQRRSLEYRVIVDPSTQGQRTRRQAGSAEVTSGQAVAVTRTFRVPRRQGYLLTVKLSAFDEQLHVRCPARRR